MASDFVREPLPINVDDDPLVCLDTSEAELDARFGLGIKPVLKAFTYPGPVKIWPLRTAAGQLVLLLLHLETSEVQLFANPKEPLRALVDLGIGSERISFVPEGSKQLLRDASHQRHD